MENDRYRATAGVYDLFAAPYQEAQIAALEEVLPHFRPEAGPILDIGAGSAAMTEPAQHEAGAGLVAAERVRFAYDTATTDAAPVLEDVSFTLPHRGLTALVGPSGSGKTTLVHLLARFWDPTGGRILIGDAELRSLSPEQISARLATVLQDDYLFDTTIGENIRLGRPDATADELSAVVRAVGLEEFVARHPEGLDTPVGAGGGRLSGGQRQRVCVARALLKAAPLTLMDEATSALDPENARLVTDAALRLSRTGSVLVIAHNLDTIARADRILVLDGGRLVASGGYDELRRRDGVFRRLLQDHELHEDLGTAGE